MDKEELNLFQKAQFWILINLFKIELTVLIVLAICFMLDSYMKTNIIKVLAFGLLANAYLFTLKIERMPSFKDFRNAKSLNFIFLFKKTTPTRMIKMNPNQRDHDTPGSTSLCDSPKKPFLRFEIMA